MSPRSGTHPLAGLPTRLRKASMRSCGKKKTSADLGHQPTFSLPGTIVVAECVRRQDPESSFTPVWISSSSLPSGFLSSGGHIRSLVGKKPLSRPVLPNPPIPSHRPADREGSAYRPTAAPGRFAPDSFLNGMSDPTSRKLSGRPGEHCSPHPLPPGRARHRFENDRSASMKFPVATSMQQLDDYKLYLRPFPTRHRLKNLSQLITSPVPSSWRWPCDVHHPSSIVRPVLHPFESPLKDEKWSIDLETTAPPRSGEFPLHPLAHQPTLDRDHKRPVDGSVALAEPVSVCSWIEPGPRR